jgi:hypothetical protein
LQKDASTCSFSRSKVRRRGKWVIHYHIGRYTPNNSVEMQGGDGLMMVIEASYQSARWDDPFKWSLHSLRGGTCGGNGGLQLLRGYAELLSSVLHFVVLVDIDAVAIRRSSLALVVTHGRLPNIKTYTANDSGSTGFRDSTSLGAHR